MRKLSIFENVSRREIAVLELRELKSEAGGDVTILGSGSLVAQLAAANRLDAYALMVKPITLGSGRTLFDGVAAEARAGVHARVQEWQCASELHAVNCRACKPRRSIRPIIAHLATSSRRAST